jgi:formate-dependent nitrite reductase membrane component NrfD
MSLELTTTRHNPLVDPVLAGWTWEIPVYLFVGGAVAGMMVMGGLAMLRVARGEDPARFASWQAPLLGFVLLNVGMLALLLDLSHRWFAWRVFLTLQPTAPMSWGSWTLIVVYGVLLLSAAVRLPSAWPALAARLPVLQTLSDALTGRPRRLALLGAANLLLGIVLGTYTGLLLATMVARPLWNSAVLPLLFLFSGLCTGSALLYIGARLRGTGPAPAGLVPGGFAALVQPLGEAPPPGETADGLVRANVAFLVAELLLIGLYLANLATSSASHAAALSLLTSGPFATKFWGIDIGLGLLLPLAAQALMLANRLPRTVLPALLVVAGGFTLRWVMVNAGQMSQLVSAAATTP